LRVFNRDSHVPRKLFIVGPRVKKGGATNKEQRRVEGIGVEN